MASIWQLKLQKIFDAHKDTTPSLVPVEPAQPIVKQPVKKVVIIPIDSVYDIVCQKPDNSYKVIAMNFPSEEQAEAFKNKLKPRVVFDSTHTEGEITRYVIAQRIYKRDGSYRLVVPNFPIMEASKADVKWVG